MGKFQNEGEILQVSDLTKSFGDLVAVDGLSFDVYRGEIFGFLGPNGAGKTTSIHMICGLIKSDSGKISFNGLSLGSNYRHIRKQIGLCPQDVVIWESLTCLEQLIFTARMYNLDPKQAKKRSIDLLEILGLVDKKKTMAKTLSGGMKRRLNIALALVHDPQFLILDEPQAGLDPQSRLLVREYIRSIADKKTVILTSHDMDEVDRLAQRIAIIDHGKLLVCETPQNLKNRVGEGDILEIKISEEKDDEVKHLKENLPKNLRHLDHQKGTLRFTGTAIPNVLPELVATIHKTGLDIVDIMIRKKTLEDVFIHLTGRRLRE